MLSLLGFFMFFFGLTVNASAEFNVKEVSMLPDAVYTPFGFDNNDNAQIVIEGIFSNSCHKSTKTLYQIDTVNKVITIQNRVIILEGVICLQVMVPYNRVIDLGILKNAGDYKIFFEEAEASAFSASLVRDSKYIRKQMATLSVVRATTDKQDDFLYAPFSSAMFSSDSRSLRLRGMIQDRCMKIKTVKVIQAKPDHNVINVLPIVELKSDCGKDDIAEEILFDVHIRNNFKKGRYLFHVRTLSGQSLNEIVDLD